jgi:hypothetical protein
VTGQGEAVEWALDDPAAMTAIASALADAPIAAATFGWTCGVLAGLGPVTVRRTTTQFAFRRRIGFAWLWRPGPWLGERGAPAVLSIGLRDHLDSPRWKQVVEPYPGRWMHHLEVRDPAELDAEVAGWLAAAYDAAG